MAVHRRALLLPALCAAVAGTCNAATATGEDWNQWRGPDRNAVAASLRLPDVLPPTLTRVWTTDIGEGYASPVVAGDRVYTFSRRQDREAITCLELETGRRLWSTDYAAGYTVSPHAAGHGRSPKSTPAVAAGLVFSLGISGILSAVDARSGAVAWRQTFSDLFPSVSPQYGASTSPMVVNDLVIVHLGGRGTGAVLAATGQTIWKSSGNRGDYAAIVAAANAILATTTDGQLLVQRFGQSAFEPQAYSVSKGPIWSYPVPTERGLLVRSLNSVSLWRF